MATLKELKNKALTTIVGRDFEALRDGWDGTVLPLGTVRQRRAVYNAVDNLDGVLEIQGTELPVADVLHTRLEHAKGLVEQYGSNWLPELQNAVSRFMETWIYGVQNIPVVPSDKTKVIPANGRKKGDNDFYSSRRHGDFFISAALNDGFLYRDLDPDGWTHYDGLTKGSRAGDVNYHPEGNLIHVLNIEHAARNGNERRIPELQRMFPHFRDAVALDIRFQYDKSGNLTFEEPFGSGIKAMYSPRQGGIGTTFVTHEGPGDLGTATNLLQARQKVFEFAGQKGYLR